MQRGRALHILTFVRLVCSRRRRSLSPQPLPQLPQRLPGSLPSPSPSPQAPQAPLCRRRHPQAMSLCRVCATARSRPAWTAPTLGQAARWPQPRLRRQLGLHRLGGGSACLVLTEAVSLGVACGWRESGGSAVLARRRSRQACSHYCA